jgi:hypothetical protein
MRADRRSPWSTLVECGRDRRHARAHDGIISALLVLDIVASSRPILVVLPLA